jgi:hypothetical protein
MLLIAALLAWAAFYMMDRHWYHPLLEGAVDHAIALEKELASDVPGIGLATAIKNASGKNKLEIRSPTKMTIFYAIFGVILVVILVLVLSGVGTDEPSIPETPAPSPTAVER